MAIPVIAPYPMPSPSELPTNAVSWTIDPGRAALLVHDMQKYFVAPFLPGCAPHDDLIDNSAALCAAFRAAGAPVIYSAQPGDMSDADRGLMKDFWGAGMSAAPADRAIIDALAPMPGEVVLTKWRASAFFRTDLLARLRAAGRDQLVVCGVYAHVGILMTAHEAYSNDIESFVVGDAIADFSAEFHRRTLDYAATRCSMAVSTEHVVGAVSGLALAGQT